MQLASVNTGDDPNSSLIKGSFNRDVHVLITVKRFPPEAPATAVLGQELAEELGRHGFRVTVAAGYPQHPYGRIFPGYQKRWLSVEEKKGYQLLRGWHLVHPSPATWVRALVMASQCASYLVSSRHAPRPQVVLSFDGYPLLGSLVSALIAGRTGASLVTVVYDLYPDIAIELQKLKNPQLIKLARALEKLTYRLSKRIVVLSEGFRQTLIRDKGVPPEKVLFIPVWLDGGEIFPQSRVNPWRREVGIPAEKFVALYAGTIGLVSGAGVVLEAARQLKDYSEILFLMVGDGYGKEEVQTRAQRLGQANLRFLPFQPRERLSELQATADVSLVTLAPGRGRTSVPSKTLGYMAAGRPVVASLDLDCDTADMIRKAQCGVVAPPGDGKALAHAVLDYYHNPQIRKQAGKKGRSYFLSKYEKDAVLKKYVDLIRDIAR